MWLRTTCRMQVLCLSWLLIWAILGPHFWLVWEGTGVRVPSGSWQCVYGSSGKLGKEKGFVTQPRKSDSLSLGGAWECVSSTRSLGGPEALRGNQASGWLAWAIHWATKEPISSSVEQVYYKDSTFVLIIVQCCSVPQSYTWTLKTLLPKAIFPETLVAPTPQ